MKNKQVGYFIIGIAILIGFIIFTFNRALTEMVKVSCSHGTSCPMWGTLSLQTNISLGVMVFVILVGLHLAFFIKEDVKGSQTNNQKETRNGKEWISPKVFDKENYKETLKDLTEDEKTLFEKILDSKGTIFQSELVDNESPHNDSTKSKFTKVKVTRILDRLEGRGLIERKRRGMTNVVILKN
jgi:hypothetical protein